MILKLTVLILVKLAWWRNNVITAQSDNRTTRVSKPCSARTIQLLGEGSGLTESVIQRAGVAYTQRRKRLGRRVAFNFIPVSAFADSDSGTNVTAFRAVTDGTLFSMSERTAMVQEILEKSHDDMSMFPVATLGIAIVFNLGGIDKINMTLETLADIYLGRIQYWNHSSIARKNPGVKFPDQKIINVARIDAGSLTYVFTDALNAYSTQWQAQARPVFYDPYECGNKTCWIDGAVARMERTAQAVDIAIAITRYTLGYTSAGSASRYGLSTVSLVNLLDKETTPTPENLRATAADVVKRNPDQLAMSLVGSTDPKAYPMSTLSYMLINTSTNTDLTCCQLQELVGFVESMLYPTTTEGQDEDIWGALPAELAEDVMIAVKSITCGGTNVYEEYLKTLEVVGPSDWEDWKTAVTAVSVCAVLLTACAVVYTSYSRYKHVQREATAWLLDITLLKMHRGDSQSQYSNSQASRSNNSSTASGSTHSLQQASGEIPIKLKRGIYNNRNVLLEKLRLSDPHKWSTKTKQMMSKLLKPDMQQKNLMAFVGVVKVEHEVYLVVEKVNKGTLHHLLRFSQYDLTEGIKYNLALDVAKGMEFLHDKSMVHGFLNSMTAYVDSSWKVKIAQWQMYMLYNLEKTSALEEQIVDTNMTDHTAIIKMIYQDPELTVVPRKEYDVYSFGMLLVEIFTRQTPYHTEVTEGKLTYSEICAPKVQRKKAHIQKPALYPNQAPEGIRTLMHSCLETPKMRPSFTNIKETLQALNPGGKSVVDAVMELVEAHMKKLEMTTKDLKVVTDRMQELLYEVLPKSIADKMFRGENVPPHSFDCVSVCFSDIVGFTTISSQSTPLEVMDMLNKMWTLFDATIDQYDVYKVDTIGDAYMVCSGLPEANGHNHSHQTAMLALALRQACENFSIPHRPEEHVRIRLGMNSGPVTAGVVGMKMPQYCVFGDTVNVASRMEATSLPDKIQVSEASYKLLTKYFKTQFDLQIRGEIDIQGKGKMTTYWLERAGGR